MKVFLIISLILSALLIACQRSSASEGESVLPADAATISQSSGMVVADIVDMVEASVVHIQTDKIKLDELNRAVPIVGAGTGVIVDKTGFIVTNNHVIRDARRILVKLTDGRVFEAEEVGGDAPTDIAVIRVEAAGLNPIHLGSSSDLRIGDQVVAVGHALDLPGGPTVTGGLVSAFRRRITDSGDNVTLRHLIQTDAAINPGNSGGPLLNMSGEVVGINTSTIEFADGISFAIAIDSIKPLVDDLKVSGVINRGFLGITAVSVTEVLAMNLGLPVHAGVSVISVVPGSPADKVGITEQDIIIRIGGEDVNTVADLDRILSSYSKGTSIEIEFFRGASSQKINVTLGERPR